MASDTLTFEDEVTMRGELTRQRHLSNLALQGEIEELARRAAAALNKRIAEGKEGSTFIIVFIVALFGEFADAIPLVGNIITIGIAAFLLYFLYGKGYFLKSRTRALLWIVGFMIDLTPVLNLLPMKSIMVLNAWRIVHARGKRAEKELEGLLKKTREELEKIESEYE